MVKKLLISGAILLFSLFSLVGCSLFNSPEKTVESYLTALLDMDTVKAEEYLVPNSTIQDLPTDKDMKNLLNEICSYIKIESVTTEKETKNTAYVNVNIQSPDIGQLYHNSIDAALTAYLADKTIDDATFNAAIVENIQAQLDSKDLKLISEHLKVKVIKGEKKWLLTDDAKTALNKICIGDMETLHLVQ
ncbi:MAG: hypothetical protein RR385_08895 [Clostridiales bacterium]